MAKFLRRRRLVAMQVALIAVAAVVALIILNPQPFEHLEMKTLKVFYGWRGSTSPSPQLVIAAIDDRSLAQQGPWPWSDRTFVALLDRLRELGAAVVGVDTTFTDTIMGDDRRLLFRLQEERDTVMGYRFFRYREDIPLEQRAWATGEDSFDMLAAQMIASTTMPDSTLPSMAGVKSVPRELRLRSGMLGFVNVTPRKDSLVLGVPLVARYRNVLLPSLGLSVAARFENFTPLVRKDAHGKLVGISIGERKIPIDPDGLMEVNFTGPAGSYERISVADILGGKLEDNALKDKIVLFGPTFQGPDLVYDTPAGKDVPAVEIWANAVDNIITSRFITCVVHSTAATVGVVIVLAIILGILLPLVRIIPSLFITIGLGAAVVVDAYLFFYRTGIWFAVATPLIAIAVVFAVLTAFRLSTEERRRRRMAVRFGENLSPKAVEQLIEQPLMMPRKGEKQHLSMLTVSLRHFEMICDELNPAQLIDFIRAYNREITAPLYSGDAYVSRLSNDGIIAIFGAPLYHADHANRTCNAALALRRMAGKRAPGWKARYRLAEIKLGVGVHTGPLIIGDVGSRGHHVFAALGREIEVSELLARLSRRYRVSIIASAETVQSTREWFTFRPLDVIRARRVGRSMEIFELMGSRGVVTPYVDLYLKAYEAYRARRFEDAVRLADEALLRLPHDGPSRLIRARARRFVEEPPKADWDGTWPV